MTSVQNNMKRLIEKITKTSLYTNDVKADSGLKIKLEKKMNECKYARDKLLNEVEEEIYKLELLQRDLGYIKTITEEEDPFMWYASLSAYGLAKEDVHETLERERKYRNDLFEKNLKKRVNRKLKEKGLL